MRLYRLHTYTTAEGSAGYQWFASRREADSTAAQWRRDNGIDGDHATVEFIDVPTDRPGLLDALNRYASHPDNG